MPGATRVWLRTYRGYRMDVRDEAGTGWRVDIYPPGAVLGEREVLRNRMPAGLESLLDEARRRVDRRLDGEGPGLERL